MTEPTTIDAKIKQAYEAQQSQLHAFRLVESALDEKKIQYSARRDELRYDFPNFHLYFGEVVKIAGEALQGTEFYPQEMPYRELMRSDPQYFRVECLLILHRDDHQ